MTTYKDTGKKERMWLKKAELFCNLCGNDNENDKNSERVCFIDIKTAKAVCKIPAVRIILQQLIST